MSPVPSYLGLFVLVSACQMIKAAKAEAEKAFLARMQSIRQKDAASKQQRRTAATERIAKIRDKIENQAGSSSD